MRKLALLLPVTLLLGSCQTFTWQGQGAGLTDDQVERGIKDTKALVRGYETETYWRGVRARMDGRRNALGRDLGHVQDMIDRHIFGYSPGDPSVNFPTNLSTLDHIGRFPITLFAR
ncbi:MAG: hypothetical protein AAF628_04070 [Planctomycetota bacterium]